MNYLIYIEHSAENLQFFLWYKDYVKRFGNANTADLSLSPEWTQSMEDEVVARLRKENAEKLRREPAVATEMFNGTDFEKQGGVETLANTSTNNNPFNTPPRTANGTGTSAASDYGSVYTASHAPVSTSATYHSQASEAFQMAGVKQPCMSFHDSMPSRQEANSRCSHNPALPRRD